MNKTNTTYRATIIARKSCRTFNQQYLTPADRQELADFIATIKVSNPDGINTDSNLFILEKSEGEKKITLDYGVIKGHNTYILGIVKDNPFARLYYGYHMEKVVLKATEMGLGSCWIGYFDHSYFDDLVIEKGYKIPGIIVIGYPVDNVTLPQRFLRFTANASKRLPWEKLFFDYTTKDPLKSENTFLTSATSQTLRQYEESLEMVRLAPSSSNTQPWRVYFDESAQEFHFFKKPKNRIYEAMGMHELDLGIAMAHFELTSHENGLDGSWIIRTGIKTNKEIEDQQYIISWNCK